MRRCLFRHYWIGRIYVGDKQMKNQYYAHGKLFDSIEDLPKFCHEWPDMPFDLEDFKNQLAARLHEADMNNQLRDGKLTNREAYQILRLSTDWALDKCIIEKVQE